MKILHPFFDPTPSATLLKNKSNKLFSKLIIILKHPIFSY